MVLTDEQYELANESIGKSKRKQPISLLFKLRNTTTSFIIQCLADREIQSILKDKQNRAYHFNCGVIHTPVTYADVS